MILHLQKRQFSIYQPYTRQRSLPLRSGGFRGGINLPIAEILHGLVMRGQTP